MTKTGLQETCLFINNQKHILLFICLYYHLPSMIPSISYGNVYLILNYIETDKTETHSLPIIDLSKP